MKVLDIIKTFSEKKIEDCVIKFKIYAPLEHGGKYLFINDSGDSYETFINTIKDSEILNLDIQYADVDVNVEFYSLNNISVEIDILK